MFSALLSLHLAAVAPATPETIFVAERPPTRVLVGDWEPPDAVAVVFSETWLRPWEQMVQALSRSTPVLVLREEIASPRVMARVLGRLPRAQQDRIWRTSIFVDSPWVRDWGPLQQIGTSGPRWLDAPYAPERPWDDVAPQSMARYLDADLVDFATSIDGGAITSNGTGLCVSTLEYFNAYVGNPSKVPLRALGCRVLALVPALRDEPTMHADMFLQFVEPQVAVLSDIDAEADPDNAQRLAAAASTLRDAAAMMRLPLSIERIPMPLPQHDLHRSYTNYFRTADMVLVPRYASVDRELEADAHDVLQRLMPDAHHIPIAADAMAREGGAIHCLTLGLYLPPKEPS